MSGIVTDKKFNELVESTTGYLQSLMDRVAKLEKRVAELETKKATAKARKDGE